MATRTRLSNSPLRSSSDSASERTILVHHRRNRLEQDDRVPGQRPISNVLAVQRNSFLVGQRAAPRDLPETCQTRLYLAIAAETVAVLLHLCRHNRPRAH